MISFFYAGLLFLACIVALIAVSILWRRRDSTSAMPLLLFMLSLAVWSITYSFHWLSNDLDMRYFWLASTYFGTVTSPVFFLVFALIYAGKGKWVTRRFLIGLGIFPFMTLIALWTDSFHGLFFGGEQSAGSRFYDGEIWFWLNVIFSYTLIFISYFLIVQTYRHARDLYREQALWILVALSVPVLANVGGFLGVFSLVDIDITPLLFTFTGIVIIYTLYYKKLLDLVPIARDRVMQTMREPFFVIDRQYRIVDVNDEAIALWHKKCEQERIQIIGTPITAFFPDWLSWLTVDDPSEIVLCASNSSQPITYEWRISSIIKEDGDVHGWLLLLNDITRRKVAIQREFELALEKERHLLLTQFIRNAAHEIRTPLTIINSTMYLMAKLDNPEQRLQKLDKVESQIRRITHLLDMLLIMMRLENADIKMDTIIDLEHLVEIISRQVDVSYPYVALHLDNNTSREKASKWQVMGNIDYLKEAFKQLLDNAYRFSSQGGLVSVGFSLVDGYLEVTIHNEGESLLENDLRHIFDIFWRKDEAHTTRGFGIGLSIAKKIIEHHGGKISVVSPYGQGGVTFSILLPAYA